MKQEKLLIKRLKHIQDLCLSELGEWQSVATLYLPERLQVLGEISQIIQSTLDKLEQDDAT